MTETDLHSSADFREAGLALLRWYADAGVDEAIGLDAAALYGADAPETAQVLQMQQSQTGAQSASQTVSKSVSLRPRNAKVPEISAEEEAATLTVSATAVAAKCATLAELREAMEGFEAKSHFPAARNIVFADGNPEAPLMLIGEAPGEQEDREGKPFVGRSGQLLDRMLAAIGRDRTNTYITNILPWRPMGNRTPTPQEALIFQPFVLRHIELVSPKFAMAVGGTSGKLLLNTTTGITRLRGNWGELQAGNVSVPILPTFHPAYLLRNSLAKREAWADLLSMKQCLSELD